MTASEARVGCVIRDSSGHAWPVPARADDEDLDVDVSLERQVTMGETDEGVVAFATFKDDEAHLDAIDREAANYPAADPKVSRLMGAIFGASIAPRLKVELLRMDGVAIYEVDLEPILPDHVLTVPCRLVPSAD